MRRVNSGFCHHGILKYELGFFLLVSKLLQAAVRRGLGVFESVFLSPIDDSRRSDPLNDPVEYPGVVARIEQNVCDVPAKTQSGIFRFFDLPGCGYQMELSLHVTPGSWGMGTAWIFLKPE